MREFEAEIRLRDETVSEIGPWYWQSIDSGAWDGPKSDWENSHVHAINALVKNRRVCVQAGGNQGMYPRILSSMFERVYTFEPEEKNFHCLVNNCQVSNVYKLQAALGAVSGLVGINKNVESNTGMHTVNETGYIPMITLDSLNLDQCDYIMLDIEGYEILALQGAFNTIDAFKPVISCENGRQEILDFLTPFGYTREATSQSDTFFVVKD